MSDSIAAKSRPKVIASLLQHLREYARIEDDYKKEREFYDIIVSTPI